jgi:hypothetical protein
MPIKTLEIPLFPHIPQLVSHPPASPTHESMKPVLTNAPADLLTCYPREAGANLLNLFQKFRLPFHLDSPTANATATVFLSREVSGPYRYIAPLPLKSLVPTKIKSGNNGNHSQLNH